MCGIAGVLSADHARVEPAVRRMMRAMIHRGPDDEGYEQLPLGSDASGPVAGFGFRRLAILDLSPAGHQPMFNPATGDCLIFNGEIYNFRWLKSKLKAEGVAVASSGDTEVLLKALSQWGERALDNLDGMYAFAFYQARSRRVLIARDHFGIKPLYVARLPRAFVFASEVRAVLASGLVPTDLDPAGIATFLAYGSPQDPLTVHKAVRSFPSGSCQWIDAGIVEGRDPVGPRRYWRFPEAVPPYPEEEAVWRIEDDLQQSVRDQCVADVPLGVFLSGGIDSATIAALACNHTPSIHTFAVGFESAGAFDETSQAAATARALGTVHSQTFLDDDWMMLQWSEWCKSADRPSIGGLVTFVVSGVVKDQGMTVALSGLGADELFGGYGHFRSIASRVARRKHVSWFSRAIFGPCTVIDMTLAAKRVLSNAQLRSLGLRANELDLVETYLPAEAYDPLGEPFTDAFHAVSKVECLLPMANSLLRDADNASMAHSLELRAPFLGKWMSERVGALPGSMRAPPGAPLKFLLRCVGRNVLPGNLASHRSTHRSLPISRWLRGTLARESEDAVNALASCPFISGTAVKRLWRATRRVIPGADPSRRLAMVVLGRYLAGYGSIG